MTWTINISGHDDLSGEEKVAYEMVIIAKARSLAQNISDMEGGHVTVASCSTNTETVSNLLEADSVA